MKKVMKLLFMILVLLIVQLSAQVTAAPQPHPDPQSGDLSSYEGRWIINGKTEQDSNWTLEISADEYHLSNDYQSHSGDIIFTPGNKDWGTPDTLWLDFDPELGIEMAFINEAGGLIDITGQGLIFVKPGNQVKFDKPLESYSKEDLIGDWVLDEF